MKKSDQLEWLKLNKEFLSINKIEIKLKMPQGTLSKYVRDIRALPESWHEIVTNWVIKFKKL